MKKLNDKLSKMLRTAYEDRGFLKESGLSKDEVTSLLQEINLYETSGMLLKSVMTDEGMRRFTAKEVAEIMKPALDKMCQEPEEGWTEYSYRYVLNRLFPDSSQDFQAKKYARGRAMYLKTLQVLFKLEESVMPYDPRVDIVLPDVSIIEKYDCNREYGRFYKVAVGNYIYEFMRISAELTPFNTLGHIAGVHHVAMYMAKQLFALDVPCDLGVVSGAAVCHDIGKYGCKKGEEKRVPYLHYYYTDTCTERFNLPMIGHIAANHSTWDLELENLSVESLLLIYADFRVKSSRDENGKELVHFYTLDEAFQVILDKLDNVDEAKKLRYRRVYNKLKDFENYMIDLGVTTEIKGSAEEEEPPKPEKKPWRSMASYSRNKIVSAIKNTAVDHNIRLMNAFYREEQFANLLEIARTEKQWRSLRTYIAILGEYSAYMTEKQKLMTLRFLYEMLTNRESDIRYQAGEIYGQIVANFNIEYRKELPEGVTLSKKRITNMTLWKKTVENVLNPDHKLTDEHKKRVSYCLKNMVKTLIANCHPDDKAKYIDVVVRCFNRRDLTPMNKSALLRVIPVTSPEDYTYKQKKAVIAFANKMMKEEEVNLRVAGAKVRQYFGVDSKNECLERVAILTGKDSLVTEEALSDMFLDNLKARTPWTIKTSNIAAMLTYVESHRDDGITLHVATHLANLIKVSETVTVRTVAGDGLLQIIDKLLPEQRNEIAVELGKGLEIGDYQFSKYIPEYLGQIMLHLSPRELDELITDLEVFLNQTNAMVASSVLHTFGVILENYSIYGANYGFVESPEATEQRKMRLLNDLMKGLGNYITVISQESLWTIGVNIFASPKLDLREKYGIFKVCSKKLMTLYENNREGLLDFFNNAAAFRHIYEFICNYEIEVGDFNIPEPKKVAFFPGTFDPFSLSHKAIAREICNRGFEVYLALDEFSWSKKTQPRLQRRRIMNMSVADEENIFLMPDNISINIANKNDIKLLKRIFQGKDLYFVAGSDVIKNASCYKVKPDEDTIHSINHIIFKRESEEVSPDFIAPENTEYPIIGEIQNLSLEKIYEDISSTRIRENIDLNRDISNLIDPVAQNYILDRGLYMREPAYKHMLQARDVTIEHLEMRDSSVIDDMESELAGRGYDIKKIREYLDRDDVWTLAIRDGARGNKIVAVAAAKRLDSFDLLAEFGNADTAEYVRAQAAGAIPVIGGFFCSRKTKLPCIEQTLLVEMVSELIEMDYTYVVYHPCVKAGMSRRLTEFMTKQGFINIGRPKGETILAANMTMPVIIFKNVSTIIKAPLNENPRVLRMVEDAHDRLLGEINKLYPGHLIISYNSGIMYQKMINLITKINDVPVEPRKTKKYGPYMAVPFGMFLENKVVPNTVTKSLHTEKYYNREITNFTVEARRNYSPIADQIRMIKSFNRQVILVDNLLNKGYRMNKIDPILKEHQVKVVVTAVGVLTGRGKDLMTMKKRTAECAYYVPNIRLWLDETSLYPYLGGDSIKNPGEDVNHKKAVPSMNMILPYAVPSFLGDLPGSSIYNYSMTCLENARDILRVLEEEYQNVFEKKLTLRRLGEVINSPKIVEVNRHLETDESIAPSIHVERDIEALTRLKVMFK